MCLDFFTVLDTYLKEWSPWCDFTCLIMGLKFKQNSIDEWNQKYCFKRIMGMLLFESWTYIFGEDPSGWRVGNFPMDLDDVTWEPRLLFHDTYRFLGIGCTMSWHTIGEKFITFNIHSLNVVFHVDGWAWVSYLWNKMSSSPLGENLNSCRRDVQYLGCLLLMNI